MKKLTLLLFCLLLLISSYAQAYIVTVDFEVEGRRLNYADGEVKFITNDDTVNVNIQNGQLLIPAFVFNKRVSVIFRIDRYLLHFDSIPITINPLSPKWTLGVDTKPFDKEKFFGIKKWKKIKIIYYLKNDDGRTFTVDNGSKSKVILN